MPVLYDARVHFALPASLLALAIATLGGCAPSAPQSGVGLNPLSGTGADLRQTLVALNGGASARRSQRSWMKADTTPPLLYVSDAQNNFVDCYSLRTKTLVGQITANHPTGLATDASNNLYVTNLYGGTTTVYAFGQSQASRTLTEPGGRPDAVAVAANGTVYVADENGSVYVFTAGGSTEPTATLSSISIESAAAVAVNSTNDVYVAGYNPKGQPEVVKYAKASGLGINLQLQGLTGPAGVVLDDRERVVLADFFMPAINVFKRNATSPYRVFAQTKNPNRLAFNRIKSRVYVPMTSNDINVYDYKSGTLISQIVGPAGSVMIGAAVVPAPHN